MTGVMNIFGPVVGTSLKAVGFEGKGQTWRRLHDELVQVAGLQKSHGDVAYLNLGFWLVAVGENDRPRATECHVRLRCAALFSDPARRLDRFMDMEQVDLPVEERLAGANVAMDQVILPFLERATSIRGLADAVTGLRDPSVLIQRDARPLLDDG